MKNVLDEAYFSFSLVREETKTSSREHFAGLASSKAKKVEWSSKQNLCKETDSRPIRAVFGKMQCLVRTVGQTVVHSTEVLSELVTP